MTRARQNFSKDIMTQKHVMRLSLGPTTSEVVSSQKRFVYVRHLHRFRINVSKFQMLASRQRTFYTDEVYQRKADDFELILINRRTARQALTTIGEGRQRPWY